MKNKIKNTISNPAIRKLLGVIFVIAGLIFMIMPIVPGAWLLIVGLEFLGLRLLVQGKLKCMFGNYWIYKKLAYVKVKLFN